MSKYRIKSKGVYPCVWYRAELVDDPQIQSPWFESVLEAGQWMREAIESVKEISEENV